MAHTDTLTNMIDNIHVDVCLSATALSTLHLTSSCVYKSGLLLCMTNTNNMLRKSGTISSSASATAIEWWLHTVQTWMQSQMPSYETSHGTGPGLSQGFFRYALPIVILPLLHAHLSVSLWSTHQFWARSLRRLKIKGWGRVKQDAVLTKLIIIHTEYEHSQEWCYSLLKDKYWQYGSVNEQQSDDSSFLRGSNLSVGKYLHDNVTS